MRRHAGGFHDAAMTITVAMDSLMRVNFCVVGVYGQGKFLEVKRQVK